LSRLERFWTDQIRYRLWRAAPSVIPGSRPVERRSRKKGRRSTLFMSGCWRFPLKWTPVRRRKRA